MVGEYRILRESLLEAATAPKAANRLIQIYSSRFFSFAVLSFISNKSDWGLSLSQLGLVIWCGGPSIINVLMLLNFYQDFGFEKSNVGKEMTRNLFGVVVLGKVPEIFIFFIVF